MRHRLHSYTLTSGAPVLPGIVRATLIGPAQLGHIGEWVFIPQTLWTPLIRVTPVAGKGSDISTAGGNTGLRSAFLCQSPTKFKLVIDPETGDRARLADGSFWPVSSDIAAQANVGVQGNNGSRRGCPETNDATDPKAASRGLSVLFG
jgi:hypothetical protein